MAIADLLVKLVELKNQLVANLNSMGVVADENEKLNTLVPKVLECETEQNVEFVEGTNFSGGTSDNPGFKNAIKKIIIPNSATKISSYAFYNCTNLESLTISNGVTSIENYAFNQCTSLADIIIPDSVTSIGDYAFENCSSATKIIIPNSVTSIGTYAFSWCNGVRELTYPGSASIGDSAFNSVDATKIIITKGSTHTNKVPSGNTVKEVILPNGITTISDDACPYHYSLVSINIPDSVTSIGNFAFLECRALPSIIIPDSVTSIGKYAFSNCRNLKNIYYTGTQEQWKAITKGTDWNSSTYATIHYNYVPE